MSRYIVGISGGSGIVLAYKALDALTKLKFTVDLVMTKYARFTALQEMGEKYTNPRSFISSFSTEQQKLIHIHEINDFGSCIASGSFKVSGMLIIPCSMATLSAISSGLSDNLLRRAADVTLKEKRSLVLVPRESPLHEIHLENMLKLARMGAVILPPQPAWYMHHKTFDDMENFMVGRALDALKIESDIYPRWTGIKNTF